MKANTSRSHKKFIHSIKQPLKNGARVFLFILKAKHKTLHVKWAWVELENSVENQFAQASIDRV